MPDPTPSDDRSEFSSPVLFIVDFWHEPNHATRLKSGAI
jgi:hypothetical protein